MLTLAGAVMLPFQGAGRDAGAGRGLYLGRGGVRDRGLLLPDIAMRTGDVSAVTPFRYTRLVFALILSVVFLANGPTR